MARKKSVRAEARWREIVGRQAGSGLSVRRFCASAGVSEPSFYAWRKRLREGQGDGNQAPPPNGVDRVSDGARLFVPLKLVDTVATLEIIHPLGYRIQVTGDVHPVTLRNVFEALEQREAR